MSLTRVLLTYSAVMDIGDVPLKVVERALIDDELGNFNIWEQGDDVKVVTVDFEDAKAKS